MLLRHALVRGHLRQGRWRRICRGVLLTGNGDLTSAQQRWVAVLVGGADPVRRRAFLRTTLTDIAGGAQALAEIDLMVLCRRFHLLLPDLQHRRRTADGGNRYLDAYWRKWQLHVEVDGAHHMDAAEWSRDMVRQNQIWIAGDRILRFPAWLIRTDPKRVADQLRVALQAADPRPD